MNTLTLKTQIGNITLNCTSVQKWTEVITADKYCLSQMFGISVESIVISTALPTVAVIVTKNIIKYF